LDHKNPIPLHIQLKNHLEQSIVSGEYKTKIPSEREIMELYSVSRSTVREAVSILVREGVLEKVHGKGTFISVKPIQDWLGTMSSTTDTIQKMGMKSGAKLISHGIVTPSENIKELTDFEEAYFIKRIRYADDNPIAIESQYYPLEIGKKLAEYDIDTGTLYDILEHDLSIQFSEADQLITSGEVSEIDAKYLEIDDGSSVLITERITYDMNGTIVEYYEGVFRSDMYSFHIKLSRKNN
jgi:GntR family transcriptional regulator